MSKAKRILLVVLLVSFVLGLAACGGAEEPAQVQAEPTQAAQAEPTEEPQAQPTQAAQAQPTEEPQAEPTDTQAPATATPTPEAVPTEEPEPELVDEETLDTATLSTTAGLSSFRSHMRMVVTSVENGEETEQVIEVTTEYTSDPAAQHMTMSGTSFGQGSPVDAIESYVVDGTMYTKLGDEWMSFPATEDDLGAEDLLSPHEMIDDTCGWKKKERTEVNGVAVQHWTLDYADLKLCAAAADLSTMGELTDLGGDMYVALDEGYIVEMDIYYVGETLDLDFDEADEEQTVQRVDLHYTVTDANEPFTIELPEEAKASSALPEDIPVPEDAEGMNNMLGMILFTSPSEPGEIADFYRTSMPDYGWTEGDSSEMAGMLMLDFTKDGKTASLIITTDDTGDTSVLISVQEE
jgi:hypothetical protein